MCSLYGTMQCLCLILSFTLNLQLKLVNESGDLVPVGEPGHVLAKTYCTFTKYKNLDPKVYAGLFTEDGFIKSG